MKAVELMSAGTCNMDCRYCFIPKNEAMNGIHKRIIGSLKDGTYIEHLKKLDGLEAISLWGTEPTLTLDYFIPNVEAILREIPSVKMIKIPTNLLTNHMSIVELAKKLDGHAKKGFELNIQVSLDGPANITDKNRKPDATEKIIAHFKELRTGLKGFDNLKIDLYFKPTITIDNIINDLDTIDKVTAWYQFFDELAGGGVPGATPTFEVPGKYTSEDGKTAYEFFRRISALNRANRKQKLFKHYKQLNNYVIRFMKLLKYNAELQHKYRMYTCSGGDTQCGLDFDGNMHLCHHTFYWDNEDYLSRIYESDSDKGRKRMAVRHEVRKDEFGKSRMLYLNRCYHDFMTFRVNSVMTMTKEMALCGQIDKEYSQSNELCYMLALFLNTSVCCPIQNYVYTGSIHITPVTLIRLLGNGCMQEIIREASNELSN